MIEKGDVEGEDRWGIAAASICSRTGVRTRSSFPFNLSWGARRRIISDRAISTLREVFRSCRTIVCVVFVNR